MSGFRNNLNHDRTPIQQSMTQDPVDYQNVHRLSRMMLGVVLEVYPSDNEDGNRSSWQSRSRRGFTHEASVLVVNDGSSAYMVLNNVIITPDAVSGLDDYCEKLPRASSLTVTGDELNASLHHIDPYDLDGDWCVIGYLGGQLDQPFIVRWWPHSRNVFDPATSGRGNPNTSGVGRALNQYKANGPSSRYFRRVNGVETTITSSGDIILSTTFAGSSLKPGGDSTRGRFAREVVENGGSVRVYMKPESAMEWVWDPQEDFVGTEQQLEDETPQENPPAGNRVAKGERTKSYVQATQERFLVRVPTSLTLHSSDDMRIEATNTLAVDTAELTATGSTSINLASAEGSIELSAATVLDLISQAVMTLTANGALTLSAGGALTLGGSSVAIGPASGGGSPGGPGAITGDSGGIALGEGATEPIIKGGALNSAWSTLYTSLSLVPPATDISSAAALANANKAAILGMISALGSALSAYNRTT